MRLPRNPHLGPTAGFSLLETVIAASLFTVVGYVFVVSVDVGSRSQELVMGTAADNAHVRTAATTLVGELQVSCDDHIDVVPLPDGNTQVTLKVPIEVGGLQVWGTPADEIAPDPKVANEAHEDWSYRYTVQQQGATKQLVRQVLDDKLAVQSEELLVEELDTESKPCFSVAKQGDMWVVAVATKNKKSKQRDEEHVARGRRSEFHVRTRN